MSLERIDLFLNPLNVEAYCIYLPLITNNNPSIVLYYDSCPYSDCDDDDVPDICDVDIIDNDGDGADDGPGIGHGCDNCLNIYNPNQEDADHDHQGDVCDTCPYDPLNDGDGDFICGNIDICPLAYNPNQSDIYPPQGNGIGDACDCEGNFNCSGDQDVDGSDAIMFKLDFGRSASNRPCSTNESCNGDFNCDGDVDGSEASLFKSDYGRGSTQNSCPVCVSTGPWCEY
jgi:hypothetical protein